MTNRRPQQSNTNGELNFVDSLWKTANKLRGSVESAEYKHIVLGLFFLKYISDAFIQRHDYLEQVTNNPENLDYYGVWEAVEEKDEYLSENIFWVPKEARWTYLMANATNPNLGKLIDGAMNRKRKSKTIPCRFTENICPFQFGPSNARRDY